MMHVSVTPRGEALASRGSHLGLPLLLFVVVLAYGSSLWGGFLNWDDPWLVEGNPRLTQPSFDALRAIWTDFSRETRLTFGAEYLPVRDTSYLLESLTTGLSASSMRCVNLLLYLGAVAALYQTSRFLFRGQAAALVATAAFALHPVHVESVAWVAGRKDVLALLLVALAFRSYVAGRARAGYWAALWFFLAMLAKSMSVALPLLLPLLDLWMQRRIRWRAAVGCLATVLIVLPLHVQVGRTVGMTTPVIGGSLSAAFATMGPVWLRYAGIGWWPVNCSLVEEVLVRKHWDWLATLGYVLLVAGLALTCWLWRWRKRVEWFVLLGCWLLPLLPVSQVIVPLQNRMADRYLWWSVLALALALAWLVESWSKWGLWLAGSVLVFWTAITVERAILFSDSVLVFADAMQKTESSGIPPYQLGMALEARGDIEGARAAFEAVWYRTKGRDETARRATNNLARLEARLGDLERARSVLLRGLRQFPDDAKMRGNLFKVNAQAESGTEVRN